MALDAAQILRQTYAAGAERIDLSSLMQKAEIAPAQSGSIMGTAFVVEADPAAELMDSMEELSFQFEEKTAKKVADRKLGEMQGPRMELVKAVEKWLAMMPDMPGREFIASMARNLRGAAKSGNMPDARELLQNLARGSTDPTHQFAMLDILEQAFGAGEEDLRALVAAAKARLSAEKGPEIRAGINLADEINARATTPEQMQELRDMYRSEVVGFTKPQDCFRSLLASRGPGGLQDAISFLLAGCGRDLASSSPSMDAAALGRIMTDLGCVQTLQTLLEDMSRLCSRMGREFGENCRLNGEQLAGRVVDLTEQAFVSAGAIAALESDCSLARLLAKMDFSRELTRLFRRLSPRLFAKEGDRQRLVDAAQEHLDELIGEEEESEASA